MEYGEYIIYVDESGDHSMSEQNKDFPIFVLAFCIFKKSDYVESIVPDLKRLKFKYFGHDIVNLHERDIRKQENSFSILRIPNVRIDFINDLSGLIEKTKFDVIAAVIQKSELSNKDKNPYVLAMKSCLEILYKYLETKEQLSTETHIVFEQRGKKEDESLELEFRRIVSKNNVHRAEYPFKIIFASKKYNSAGLQLADMIARPIGIHTIRPAQQNRAFEIIDKKFFRPNGNNLGLTVIPQPEK